jgi:hypothetical protein
MTTRSDLLPQSYHLVRGPAEGTFSLVGNLQYAAAGFPPPPPELTDSLGGGAGGSGAPGLSYTQAYIQQVPPGANQTITQTPVSFTSVPRPHR